MNHFITIARITFIFGIFALATPAFSALGDKESSVETDRKAFAGVHRNLTEKSTYKVHEITNDHLTIREYIAGGVVFAISWSGSRHPDLNGLLGSYFTDFQSASRQAVKVRGQRAHRRLSGSKVVVEKSGHMRWVQGKAYAPDLMPSGVTADEIQ